MGRLRRIKIIIITFFAAVMVSTIAFKSSAESQLGPMLATEAPTGFDNGTNGLVNQAQHDLDRRAFEEREGIEDGLGPVYNAQSCSECHASPVTGGGSQVTSLRAGHFDGSNFIDPPGGSFFADRAIDPSIQQIIPPGNEVRSNRIALSMLGDGYIEAIADNTIIEIANSQPAQSGGRISGQAVQGLTLEAPGMPNVGRFGWKSISASLLTFSSLGYFAEMGISNPLLPFDRVTEFDNVPDPEDRATPEHPYGVDVEAFTDFVRATKAPSRDLKLAATPESQAGSQIFNRIGCAICHVPNIITAPAGTLLHGGTYAVPQALGNKIIHPFSDFLLHDIGVGDGIVETLFGLPQSTRNKMRTQPLWGLRTRSRLMHDGRSNTISEAIQRHGGEASFVTNEFNKLSNTEKNQLLIFLRSL